MKEYISKEYINNLLARHLNDWCGPEHYACSIIKDEIDSAPKAETLLVCIDEVKELHGRN